MPAFRGRSDMSASSGTLGLKRLNKHAVIFIPSDSEAIMLSTSHTSSRTGMPYNPLFGFSLSLLYNPSTSASIYPARCSAPGWICPIDCTY